MDIGRDTTLREARKKVKFCLDVLEAAEEPSDVNGWWSHHVTDRLTMEEMIGALIAAEQELDRDDCYNDA